MNKVKISLNIHKLLNNCRLGIIQSNVKIENSSHAFNEHISKTHQEIIHNLTDKRETEFEIIRETRQAYKVCGKEPSRYRPSAEALLRRLRTKKDLYQINNVVDAINLMSISTHYSIGGFDQKNIKGDLILDIGDSEPYEAIGRGVLNIEFMPGMRDSLRFFGTPTSDSVRTMVNNETTDLLLVFYDFYSNDSLGQSLDIGESILAQYCGGTSIIKSIVSFN